MMSIEMLPLLREFLFIFIIFLTGYYFLPVLIYYLIIRFKNKAQMQEKKIQVGSFPTRSSVKREILWSISSICIFSVCATILYQLIKAGRTNLYYEISDYGLVYFLLTPFLCIIIHDTYYYWLHRMMHHKLLFRYIHRVHHLSVTPTPWAIYSFQPLEAFFSFLSVAIIIFLLPVHPISFGVYMLIGLINNIGGHTGYEILPSWFVDHPVMKYTTVVTFHDMHHTHTKYNFGAYFNIWDRVMHTVHKDFRKKFISITAPDKHEESAS